MRTLISRLDWSEKIELIENVKNNGALRVRAPQEGGAWSYHSRSAVL